MGWFYITQIPPVTVFFLSLVQTTTSRPRIYRSSKHMLRVRERTPFHLWYYGKSVDSYTSLNIKIFRVVPTTTYPLLYLFCFDLLTSGPPEILWSLYDVPFSTTFVLPFVTGTPPSLLLRYSPDALYLGRSEREVNWTRHFSSFTLPSTPPLFGVMSEKSGLFISLVLRIF